MESSVFGGSFRHEYWGGNIEEDGERIVMRYVKEHSVSSESPIVIFDVGANKGEYTKAIITTFHGDIRDKGYEIHAFEPATSTFKILQSNVDNEHVYFNNFGLSDMKTESRLYYDEEGSGLASLYCRQFDDNIADLEFNKSELVKLETLDEYCGENDITHIDLLKMDVEGNEIKVLEGGRRMISEARIRSIQFEFGGCNIDSRTYFRDFWNILHERYYIYRIMRDGLQEITRYVETLEIFSYQNYFAFSKGK